MKLNYKYLDNEVKSGPLPPIYGLISTNNSGEIYNNHGGTQPCTDFIEKGSKIKGGSASMHCDTTLLSNKFTCVDAGQKLINCCGDDLSATRILPDTDGLKCSSEVTKYGCVDGSCVEHANGKYADKNCKGQCGCYHDPEKGDCNGNGQCINGSCVCHPATATNQIQFVGKDCSQINCDPSSTWDWDKMRKENTEGGDKWRTWIEGNNNCASSIGKLSYKPYWNACKDYLTDETLEQYSTSDPKSQCDPYYAVSFNHSSYAGDLNSECFRISNPIITANSKDRSDFLGKANVKLNAVPLKGDGPPPTRSVAEPERTSAKDAWGVNYNTYSCIRDCEPGQVCNFITDSPAGIPEGAKGTQLSTITGTCNFNYSGSYSEISVDAAYCPGAPAGSHASLWCRNNIINKIEN
jgi:hypothetical protein